MRRIQKTIQVTNATAMIDRVPPKRSWASKLRLLEVNVSTAPNARLSATAASTPIHDRAQPGPVVGLDQVGDENADDQRRLEALPQTDQVVREHAVRSLRRILLR